MISALMWPLLIGLLLSGGFEALLKPRPRPFWQRGVAANGVHAGSWVLLFGLLVLLLQRPWFAVMVFLSLQLVVVQSSNTKSNTLNEPFICHDFEYFWDALLHPRLYVPFFGVGLAIAASSAAAVAIGAFFYWETSLVTSEGASRFLISAFEVIAIGVLVLSFSTPKLPAITLQPTQDLQRLGLFASLWAYGMALMRSPIPTPEQSPFYHLTEVAKASKDEQILPNQTLPNQTLPNIVLVQSESFFDPRPWCEEVDANLLRHYDNTRTKALQHGALNVPAWGANTVRTECAVLTGIPPDQWGARQFNPYRTLSRHPRPSLASALKAAGYRTVCVHPYLASFYFRHKVIPLLGFDHFIDINAFESCDKSGHYISDLAVARKIGRLLEDDDNRPLFIFVITMENHGPLHLEAPNQTTLANTLPNAPWPLPGHLRDLAVYLHHLSESDKMLASVKNSLNTAKRPGLLGWYGDHVPILPEAYTHFTPPDSRTPYMIWSTEQMATASLAAAREPFELAANELGVQLFKQVFGHAMNSDVIKAEPEPQEQE
ncbi:MULTISPECIES: LTA synthase family protein [Halomonadaceae]|uniref:LTA synthase family protein n=2 Tax=Vreelandella TaxID=3137766 RepID=A0A7Z0LTP3_9GAMM|nr:MULTISPECIES: LTA synthase family protein [Halomonas]AJY51381.1 sulfatase [Halomonas sp. KO116]NYS78396.1 LTA synthase family protein [Halomonas glaciei]